MSLGWCERLNVGFRGVSINPWMVDTCFGRLFLILVKVLSSTLQLLCQTLVETFEVGHYIVATFRKKK